MELQNELRVVVDPVETAVCIQCGATLDVRGREPFSSITCPSCGTAQAVPARLGQFLLLRLLSRGGMGGVFCARDETLGRLVALKVMLRSLGEDADFVERFKREAQAAARLNHPNVAQIYSFGQEKGQPYIVMELVSGERLDKLIEEKKALDQAFVLHVGLDIAEGLNAADEIGLVHGDIKPENILLDEKGHAKLVDFGIATFAREAAQGEGIWGTPYYIAPERIRHQRIDARSDIYSLGATLYHALAGRPPFEGKTSIEVVRARLEANPPPLRKWRPDIDPQVEKIVSRMLQCEPLLRYPTYASLIGDLRKALEILRQQEPASGAITRVRRIQIRKKGTPAGTAAGPSPDVSSTEGGSAEPLPRVNPPREHVDLSDYRERLTEMEEAARTQRRRKIRIVLLTLLFTVGAVFLGLRWYTQRMAKQAQELEIRRVQLTRQAQIELAQSLLLRIRRATAALGSSKEAADPLVAQLTNAAVAVLGALPETAPATAATDEGAPGTQETEVPAQPGEAVAPPAATAPQDEEESDRQKMTEVIIGALGKAESLAQKVSQARQLESAAASQMEEVERASDVALAAQHVTALSNYLAQAEQTRIEINALLSALEQAAQDAQKLVADVNRKRAIRRAAEEQRRREEERLARIQSELARIAELREKTSVLIKQVQFDEALKIVRKEVPTYQTPEGLRAVKTLEERCALLVALHAFIIESLNSEVFRWGWDRGRGDSEDVLGANSAGVILKERIVPWNKVSPAQMRRFFMRYLTSERVRPAVLGKHYLAAAIFFSELGMNDLATAYVDKALKTAPSLKTEIARFLPDEQQVAP